MRRLTYAAFVVILGCSSERPLPQAVPLSEPTPRVLTDLSSLSGGSEPKLHSEVSPIAAPKSENVAGESQTDANLNRLFLETPGSGQFAGSAEAPGETRLTNSKAAQFAVFSRTLLRQLFVATQQLERKDLVNEVLSSNTQPVVISAVLDKTGKLTDLVLEQQSGSGRVDQMMLKACKTGLWATNPPPAAVASDGNYHLKIEAKVMNFNRTTQANVWNFDTRLGLGLE